MGKIEVQSDSQDQVESYEVKSCPEGVVVFVNDQNMLYFVHDNIAEYQRLLKKTMKNFFIIFRFLFF